MSRSVPEWIGKTDDTPVPRHVKARVFDAHGGICHIAKRKIAAGEPWECDHVVALINGGQNRESNLAPALVAKHKEKTARDVAEKARIAEKRAKHIGLARPKSRLTHPTLKRGFDGKVRPRSPLPSSIGEGA